MTGRRLVIAFLALAGSGVLSPARAQSLLGANGPGFPLQAVDAKARSLGGIGVGLAGAYLLPSDPAAAADLNIPALTFTVQNAWVTTEEAGGEGDASGTRFPVMAASYPVRGLGTVSIGFGSVLDQRWRLERRQTLVLAGTGTEARVTDEFFSDGGVSAIRLGIARRIAPSLAVGVQVGNHVGDLTRRFTRTFDSLEVETSVPPYQIGGFWRYSGLTATFGAAVDVGSVGRIAASYTWSEDLEAEASEDTDGGSGTYAMPAEFRVGGSAALSPSLGVSAGVHWTDWSSTRSVQGAEGRSTLAVGGGAEWSGVTVLGKPGSLRLGYRRAPLPFPTEEGDDPLETAVTAGLGIRLLQAGATTLASVDFALDRGSRRAGLLDERFWRLSTSVRISGF